MTKGDVKRRERVDYIQNRRVCIRRSNINALVEYKVLEGVNKKAVFYDRQLSRKSAKRGIPPNFEEVDYVLLARSDFHAGGKWSLLWRAPHRIT